ncbi:hypothetical protein HDV01_004434 [Terramyces sp. JEL0728]|nr:hypothetical protein HDV01_004434 [Terramyces sp. JEL0728]
MQIYSKMWMIQPNSKIMGVAKYLVELASLNRKCLGVLPSVVAKTCLHLAYLIVEGKPLPNLNTTENMTLKLIYECLRAPPGQLIKKFTSREHGQASLIVQRYNDDTISKQFVLQNGLLTPPKEDVTRADFQFDPAVGYSVGFGYRKWKIKSIGSGYAYRMTKTIKFGTAVTINTTVSSMLEIIKLKTLELNIDPRNTNMLTNILENSQIDNENVSKAEITLLRSWRMCSVGICVSPTIAAFIPSLIWIACGCVEMCSMAAFKSNFSISKFLTKMNFFAKYTNIIGGYSDVKEDNLNLVPLNSLGLSASCTSIATDEAQSTLAIGKLDGVTLFGKEFELQLCLPPDTKPGPVTRLYFKTGDKQLVGVIGSQTIIWNLAQLSLSFSFEFAAEILDAAVHPESQWIIVALANGQIKLLDFTSKRLSDYEFNTGITGNIKCLKTSPVDPNLVFIGYESEAIIWNCSQSKQIVKYEYEEPKLVNCCWSLDGAYISTVHENGSISLWSTKKKKTLIGKTKTKQEYQFQDFEVIYSVAWVDYQASSYLFICSGTAEHKLTRIQLDFEKFKNSRTDSILVPYLLFSLEALVSTSPVVVGVGMNSILAFDLELSTVDLPPSLSLYGAVIKNWNIAEDGYDIINAQQGTNYDVLKGGTVIKSNTTRNYHVLITARDNVIDLWHLAIPYPKFISRFPASLDFSKYTLKSYLEHQCIVVSNETSIIGFRYVAVQDMDALMAQIDATMDIVQNDSQDIKVMMAEVTSAQVSQQVEDDVHSFKDDVAEQKPKTPPDALETYSDMPSFLTFSTTRNNYFEDPHWTTTFELNSTAPIVTCTISHSLDLIALATPDQLSILNFKNAKSLFNLPLSSLPGSSVKIISNMRFSLSVYHDYKPCLYLYTPSSIFTFIIEEQGLGYKLVPELELQLPGDVGHVHSIDFVDKEGNCIKQTKRPSVVYMALVGSLRTFILQCTRQQDFVIVSNRAVENETIVKGRFTFNDSIFLTIVTLQAIKVFDLSLNLVYQTRNDIVPRLSSKELERIHISSNGILGMKVGDQFELLQLFPNPNIPKVDTRVYDLYNAQKYNDSKGRKLFTRNAEADKTFAPVDKSIVNSNEFSELGNKLNERGEKLEEIQEKSSRLADSSRTFVDTIKEYNKKQADKKWWQL